MLRPNVLANNATENNFNMIEFLHRIGFENQTKPDREPIVSDQHEGLRVSREQSD